MRCALASSRQGRLDGQLQDGSPQPPAEFGLQDGHGWEVLGVTVQTHLHGSVDERSHRHPHGVPAGEDLTGQDDQAVDLHSGDVETLLLQLPGEPDLSSVYPLLNQIRVAL